MHENLMQTLDWYLYLIKKMGGKSTYNKNVLFMRLNFWKIQHRDEKLKRTSFFSPPLLFQKRFIQKSLSLHHFFRCYLLKSKRCASIRINWSWNLIYLNWSKGRYDATRYVLPQDARIFCLINRKIFISCSNFRTFLHVNWIFNNVKNRWTMRIGRVSKL